MESSAPSEVLFRKNSNWHNFKKPIPSPNYIGNGKHPNSLAALAKNREACRKCERCNRLAMREDKFCYFCRRRWPLHAKSANNTYDADVARFRFYKSMGPNLQAFVEECIAQPESDQFNLSQELAVSRDLLDEAIGLYEAAKKVPLSHANRNQMLATAGALLSSASREVRETCKVGAEVFEKSRDKFSAHTLIEVVAQIKRMIRNCFEHDHAGLERFDKMLLMLRLPKIDSEGTTITPDQDVLDMDASIPRVEDDSVVNSFAEDAMLLLSCPQCQQYFNHPDTNCTCPTCNVELIEVPEVNEEQIA